MRRLMAALGPGLILAGCATTVSGPPPPPPPPPPANRALVAWAETTCTQAKEIDDMRGKFGELEKNLTGPQAESYVRGAARSVDSVTKALKDLKPSGIQAADGHVAALVRALDGVRPQLPPVNDTTLQAAPDEAKLAKAKQVGAAIATIEAQGPKLAALAEGMPELISSYNVAPGCSPVKQYDERARALLVWSNVLCTSTKSLLALDTDPLANPALADPRFAQFAGVELAQYITRWSSSVERIGGQLASAPSTGIREADEYRSGIATAVREALPKLPKNDLSTSQLWQQPIEQLKAQAIQVADTLKSLQPRQPDLATVAATNPDLLSAYNLAPACAPPETPSTELPAAANGTDVTACQSGKCQIQVNGAADVAMSGFTFKISVTASGVSVASDTGLLHLGVGGQGTFGNGDKSVQFNVLGHRATTAVLDISTS